MNDKAKREYGTYWVRHKKGTQWEIAHWMSDENCWRFYLFIDEMLGDDEFAEIDERPVTREEPAQTREWEDCVRSFVRAEHLSKAFAEHCDNWEKTHGKLPPSAYDGTDKFEELNQPNEEERK